MVVFRYSNNFVLQVRSLVLSPQEDMRAWLKFASMCRKEGRLILTHKILVNLLAYDPAQNPGEPLSTAHPSVKYQYCKYLYAYPEHKTEAFTQLHNFLSQLPVSAEPAAQKLISRVYLKLGTWHQVITT